MHTKAKIAVYERLDGDMELVVPSLENAVMATFYGDDSNSECFPVEANAFRVRCLWNAADDLGLSTKDIQDGILREMKEFIKIIEILSRRNKWPDINKDARAILAKLDKEG